MVLKHQIIYSNRIQRNNIVWCCTQNMQAAYKNYRSEEGWKKNICNVFGWNCVVNRRWHTEQQSFIAAYSTISHWVVFTRCSWALAVDGSGHCCQCLVCVFVCLWMQSDASGVLTLLRAWYMHGYLQQWCSIHACGLRIVVVLCCCAALMTSFTCGHMHEHVACVLACHMCG